MILIHLNRLLNATIIGNGSNVKKMVKRVVGYEDMRDSSFSEINNGSFSTACNLFENMQNSRVLSPVPEGLFYPGTNCSGGSKKSRI